jgi:hypothetical protein
VDGYVFHHIIIGRGIEQLPAWPACSVPFLHKPTTEGTSQQSALMFQTLAAIPYRCWPIVDILGMTAGVQAPS